MTFQPDSLEAFPQEEGGVFLPPPYTRAKSEKPYLPSTPELLYPQGGLPPDAAYELAFFFLKLTQTFLKHVGAGLEKLGVYLRFLELQRSKKSVIQDPVAQFHELWNLGEKSEEERKKKLKNLYPHLSKTSIDWLSSSWNDLLNDPSTLRQKTQEHQEEKEELFSFLSLIIKEKEAAFLTKQLHSCFMLQSASYNDLEEALSFFVDLKTVDPLVSKAFQDAILIARRDKRFYAPEQKIIKNLITNTVTVDISFTEDQKKSLKNLISSFAESYAEALTQVVRKGLFQNEELKVEKTLLYDIGTEAALEELEPHVRHSTQQYIQELSKLIVTVNLLQIAYLNQEIERFFIPTPEIPKPFQTPFYHDLYLSDIQYDLFGCPLLFFFICPFEIGWHFLIKSPGLVCLWSSCCSTLETLIFRSEGEKKSSYLCLILQKGVQGSLFLTLASYFLDLFLHNPKEYQETTLNEVFLKNREFPLDVGRSFCALLDILYKQHPKKELVITAACTILVGFHGIVQALMDPPNTSFFTNKQPLSPFQMIERLLPTTSLEPSIKPSFADWITLLNEQISQHESSPYESLLKKIVDKMHIEEKQIRIAKIVERCDELLKELFPEEKELTTAELVPTAKMLASSLRSFAEKMFPIVVLRKEKDQKPFAL